MRAIAAREDIREQILDAAEGLLVRYGYKKMTIDDIAKEVGIGKGTINKYINRSAARESYTVARVLRGAPGDR